MGLFIPGNNREISATLSLGALSKIYFDFLALSTALKRKRSFSINSFCRCSAFFCLLISLVIADSLSKNITPPSGFLSKKCLHIPNTKKVLPVALSPAKPQTPVVEEEEVVEEELPRFAVVGRPNAGKSSFINTLIGKDRYIVTDIAGTTRDAIEDELNIGGIGFRFIDTAGIRDTKDVVESIGIKKTFEKIEQAQVVIYLFDSTEMDMNDVKVELESFSINSSGMFGGRFKGDASKILDHTFDQFFGMKVVEEEDNW